ncbi:MAG: extracellular solute-binding protein [Devosia nanyangense]|uniref:Extracellular solute-binding protein n=1 Tax=Devosia nanyangense TaxID=1228055 RepID=A0A933KYV7_9HYPH|nr:extracellular solute-binding protein [Devosia nanyangense]
MKIGNMIGLGRIAAAALMLAAIAAPAAAEDVTLKMWTLDNTGYPEFIAQAAEKFKKLHPGVTVVHETFPGDQYKTSIQVALVGSAPPDVFFNWAGQDAARLVKDGLVLDLTELGNADGGFRHTLSEGWQDTFRYDGGIYGVPVDAVSVYLYYNKGFFDEHKLLPPKAFSELTGLCKAVRAIDPNIVPMPLGNAGRWKAIHLMTMLNERVVGQAASAADYGLTAPADQLFTNPGYAGAYGALLEMQDAGCFEDAPNATESEQADVMFSSGVSPMAWCGTWCMSDFDTAGVPYDMVRFPAIEGGKGDAGAYFLVPEGYQVSSKTAHPDLAAAWVSFLVSDAQAEKFAEILKFLPANANSIDKVDGATEHFKFAAADMASYSAGVNVLDVLLEASVAEAYLNATVEVLNRTLTPEQAVAQIRDVALKAKATAGL